ncbi:MAG TPA: hypothetical protein VJM77_09580 [Nitrospiria bacterium]|nr:hypothetical protein [Nitrospiria bacterium]
MMARHPALPVTGRGMGASEDARRVPHGPPHKDTYAATTCRQAGTAQQMVPYQRIRG